MSNALLAAIGMVVTLIAFAAFSVVQLAKAEAQAGRPDRHTDDPPVVDEERPRTA